MARRDWQSRNRGLVGAQDCAQTERLAPAHRHLVVPRLGAEAAAGERQFQPAGYAAQRHDGRERRNLGGDRQRRQVRGADLCIVI